MAAEKKSPAKKTTSKPAAPKKDSVKKVAAKKPAAAKAPAKKASVETKTVSSKTTAITEKYNKTQILSEIADVTGLARKDVGAVIDELSSIIERHIKKRGVGEFTMPGLLKIKTVKKPAQKAKKGVPNPFRPGELMDVAAKPASSKVKILPLKKLKDAAL